MVFLPVFGDDPTIFVRIDVWTEHRLGNERGVLACLQAFSILAQ